MIPAWLIKDAKTLGGAGVAIALLWQGQGQVLQRLDKLTEVVNTAVVNMSVEKERSAHLDKRVEKLENESEYFKANAVFKRDIRYMKELKHEDIKKN